MRPCRLFSVVLSDVILRVRSVGKEEHKLGRGPFIRAFYIQPGITTKI